MQLKTVDKKQKITLKDYTEEECRAILTESDAYVLKCVHASGEDYGGDRYTEESSVSYETIIPERILVENGRFCGVLLITAYQYYNGGDDSRIEETVLRISDKGIKSARSGFSFSNDDHSRWDYTDYYLVDWESVDAE